MRADLAQTLMEEFADATGVSGHYSLFVPRDHVSLVTGVISP